MNKRMLVVVGVIALIALGLWWGKSHQAAQDTEVSQAAPGVAMSPNASAPAIAAAPDLTSAVPSSTADLGALSARMLPQEPPGWHRLEGRVIDEAGKGIGGASVTVGSLPPRIATTEADGTFAIDGLLPRVYRVSAAHETRVAPDVFINLTTTSEPVTLILSARPSVEFRVVSEDGQPVRQAVVFIARQTDGVFRNDVFDEERTTDADGKAQFLALPYGRYRYRVAAEGFATRSQGLFTVWGKTTWDVTLQAGTLLSGRVVAANGPVPGACIAFSFDGMCEAMSAADGTFTVRTRKQRMVTARMPGLGRGEAPAVEGKPLVIELVPNGSIAGRVLDAQGGPVARAVVKVGTGLSTAIVTAVNDRGDAIPALVENPLYAAVTGPDGTFVVADVAPGAYGLIAYTEGLGSPLVAAQVDSAVAARVSLVLAAQASGALEGTVKRTNGEAVEGAWVRILGSKRNPPDVWHAMVVKGAVTTATNAEGGFRVTGLIAGEYTISAVPRETSDLEMPVAEAVATTGGRVALILPQTGAIKGTAPTATSYQVSCKAEGMTCAISRSFEAGQAIEIDLLPVGPLSCDVKTADTPPLVGAFAVVVKAAATVDVGKIGLAPAAPTP